MRAAGVRTALLAAWLLVAACGDKSGPAAEVEPRAEPPAQTKTAAPIPPSKAVTEPETADGYQLIRAKTAGGDTTELKIKAPEGWMVVTPPDSPDPHGGKFTLQEALEGLPKKGGLVAELKTNMGTFFCDLFEKQTPVTVANFAGLARGKRSFWDGDKPAWVKRPYYDGTIFHRVMPRFMIQGGDHTNSGQGLIGYQIKDELSPKRKHDRGGQLCMANKGPNRNESQFFITEGPAPHLDNSYTIFGQCMPLDLVYRVARVPQSGKPKYRPLTPVVLESVQINRVEGGAVAIAPPGSDKSLAGPPGKAIRVDAPE